ncbi:hypothetical protein, partial [Pelomonas sp. KK5]|uniref:hypothetical protein n=1 Tax=Pelomonas sp. KK5 TaxID=1855730 RepID=UPI0013019EA0
RAASQSLLLTPLFDARGEGNAVLALLPDGGAQAFAETGALTLRFTALGNTTLTLRQGEWMNLGTGRAGKPALSAHPGPDFVRQVPRGFLDPLPTRADKFAGRPREAKPVGAISYADAKPWIDHADPALRRLALLRWKQLAKKTEFRAGLVAGIKTHPEWQVILYPPD